jgi:hypothetical protein
MMLPEGAVKVNRLDGDDPFCQNEQSELGGGDTFTCEGWLTDTDVSDTSLAGLLFAEGNNTEHVTAAPCEAGGVQISIWLTFTD